MICYSNSNDKETRVIRGEPLIILVTLSFILFTIILVRTAWLGDDAYITFRTEDNFVNDYDLA